MSYRNLTLLSSVVNHQCLFLHNMVVLCWQGNDYMYKMMDAHVARSILMILHVEDFL